MNLFTDSSLLLVKNSNSYNYLIDYYFFIHLYLETGFSCLCVM